jgi:CRISPR-associated protein Cmr6
MTLYRRAGLQEVSVQKDTHAGLWLDKYLIDDGDDAKKIMVKDIAETIQIPDLYKNFYKKWEKTLKESKAVTRKATTQGRLAINLGSETTLETSIAMHHTYGVPYIPGSALKGLSAHYAINSLDAKEWGRGTRAFQIIFGDMTNAGYVNFFDALYVPGSGPQGRALWPDIITVHHPGYYQGQEDAPADWDSPIPIPFLTTSGSFLVALSGPSNWVNAALQILGFALEREGIGAKTSSGYGRMKLEGMETNEAQTVEKKSSVPQEVPAGYQRGVVKKFLTDYGFIQPDGGGPEVFVHISQLSLGTGSLKTKQRVIYKPGPGKKPGQLQAYDVRLEL